MIREKLDSIMTKYTTPEKDQLTAYELRELINEVKDNPNTQKIFEVISYAYLYGYHVGKRDIKK